MLQKSETNNAIITTLTNVRKHPNADRLKLATVFGTQVIVGLDAKDGDFVIYFDSNLRLSPEYLHWNNLYSNKEMNRDTSQRGYFGKNGKVRAQKLRGELSNGFVAPTSSLDYIEEVRVSEIVFNEGDEFTNINSREICSKYIVPCSQSDYQGRSKKPPLFQSDMFHRHWDTKQLMREKDKIASGVLYIEEKIHGTSGRVANVLCHTGKRWWQLWKPALIWKVISGTRRVDLIQNSNHMYLERKEIEGKVAPNLHQGEQLYYEIYGHTKDGKEIQRGFSYGCAGGQYKVILYRITITTPDGFCIDLDREQVYKRAEEIGLEKPILLGKFYYTNSVPLTPYQINLDDMNPVMNLCNGKSAIDANTMREGIVVWFKDIYGKWDCLKHKSEEFLIKESELRDKEIEDVEDSL